MTSSRWPDWALRFRALTRLELNQFADRPILARRILGLPVPRPDRFTGYGKTPCRKCGEPYVTSDRYDGAYVIRCDSCGDAYQSSTPQE